MGVGRVEGIGGAQHIAPARREVAVRHAHLIRVPQSERELVQSLAETDALDIGDLSGVPFDFTQIGYHAVGVVPAGGDGELARVIAPLEIERKRGGESHGVVLVGAGTLLVLVFSRLLVVLSHRIENLIAAVRSVEVETDAQPEIAHAQIENRPFVAVPAVRSEGFGIRQQILRKQGDAQIEVDIVFVHGLEGIEGHGGPAMDIHQIGHLAVSLRAVHPLLTQRIDCRETHRIEVHDVPPLAVGIHDVERQFRRRDRDQRVGIGVLRRHMVTAPVVGGQQHPFPPLAVAPRHRHERSVSRRRDAVFAAGLQVETVGFVPARSDRAEIEPAAARAEVAQRNVGAFGNGMHAVAVDAAEPHARIVGDDNVIAPRGIVPRQSVNLGPVGRRKAFLRALLSLHDDRIAAVGIVFDPRDGILRRRGIERVAASDDHPGRTVGEVHVAQLRIDPLFEEFRTAIFGPPHAAPPAMAGRVETAPV